MRNTLPDVDSLLAHLYAPVLPYLRKVRITRSGPRGYNPRDILVPEGFVVEVVATGFNSPVHCCFDEQGFCYVSEAGHKIDSKPRILKMDTRTGTYSTFLDVPEERWKKTGALTGSCWLNGVLYFTNTDTLSRVGPEGTIEDVVTGLPGLGDHQTNYPVPGPDGTIYFGQGSATNTGVVGADNFAYEWLPHFPRFHDVPAQERERDHAETALVSRSLSHSISCNGSPSH